MSLGQWLDAVLQESGADTATRIEPPLAARDRRHDDPPAREDIGARASVERRLDRLVSAMGSDSMADEGPAYESPAYEGGHSLRGIARRLDRLSAAVPEGASRGAARETIRELEERLQDIARRVESKQRPAFIPPPARPSSVSAAPMDGLREAIAEIASRQKTLEVEFDRAVSGYADRVDHRIDIVAERLERTIDEMLPAGQLREIREELRTLVEAGGAHAGQTKDFADLRQMVTEIARRIETVPGEVADDLASRLEDAVRRLDTATRSEMDSIRGELREIAQDLDRSTRGELEAMRVALAKLTDRVEALPAAETADIDTRLGAIAARFDTTARDEIGALRKELRALGDRLLEERTAVAATTPVDEAGLAELDAIRADIRGLAEQIDGVRRDDYAALRRDMQELGERMTRVPELRTEELEKQIAQLSEQLAGAARDDDPVALAQIEQRIARLAEQVDISSRQTAGSGALEKTVADLFARIEASRADTVSAAREAAGQAIERALAALGGAAGGGGVGGAEIFAALRDELADQRKDAEATGQRTQEALQLVHTTLMKVVERLEELEDEVDEVAGDVRPPARSLAGEPDGLALRAAAMDLAAEAPRRPMADPEPERTEAVAAIEDDMPLEPGTGRPRSTPLRSDPPAGEGSSSADFVAAARRAAQAAVAEQAGGGEAAKRRAAAERKAADRKAGGGLRGALAKYRRPLVIAAAMLLLIYGSMKIASMLKTAPENTSALDLPAIASLAPQIAPEPAATAPAARVVTEIPAAAPKPAEVAAKPAKDRPAKDRAAKAAGKTPGPKKPNARTADGKGGKTGKGGNGANKAKKPNTKMAGTTPEAGKAAAPVALVSAPAAAPAAAPASAPASEGAAPLATPVMPAAAVLAELPAATTPEKLRQAAAAGDPTAEFEVAVRYADGRGLPQSLSKAAEWYRKAAAQGLAPAQYRLGSLYEKGEGVERDLAMARMWYQRAAEQGNRKAMHNLAVLYADGIDGKPDFEKAAIWFRQAAEYGLADSQFNLAVLFARGLGVQTDYAESFRWFAIAADQGDGEALGKRDEVARHLDQETLLKARAALDAWSPKTPEASANVVPEPQGGWGDVQAGRQAFIDRDMVMSAQSLLTRLGYSPGPADGQIGPRTRDAVRAFQRAVGMPATGDITPELIERLDNSAG